MSHTTVYLDHNATTPLSSEVFAAMKPYLTDRYANPSSVYDISQQERQDLETARDELRALLGAKDYRVIFTGGGTESDNLAITGVALANQAKGRHIITSAVEHHAVLNTFEYLSKRHGFEVTIIPVDTDGLLDLHALEQAIRKDTNLISIMYANNETGVIQPVELIANIAKKHNVFFHTDAVQVAGKLPIDLGAMGADALTLSAHKFYGPKGVGALLLRKGIKIDPILHGGHQEGGLRAGTENTAGIIGMVAALKQAMSLQHKEYERELKLRNYLESGLRERIPEIQINGHPEQRLANTTNVIIKYVEGESMLLLLDQKGICASSGSACTSGSLDPSHVLLAMGVPHEIAHGSLRFSTGRLTTMESIDKVLSELPGIVERLRSMSPLWKG